MKRKSEVNGELKTQFESIIRTRISSVLEIMYDRPDELVDLESGEKYICSTCDLEYKRCAVEPDYRCEMARKHETELKELELAMSRLKYGTFGYCEGCSRFIGIAQLEKSPTRTFCDECAKAN